MPRVPDLPCADCGKLMWSGTTSLPEGKARCLPCRRAKPTIRSPKVVGSRDCLGCGVSFAISRHTSPKRYCSRSCANSKGNPEASRQGRTCEVCGDSYKANHAGQRTCGRECGVVMKQAASPGKTWRVYFPECEQCAQMFTSRNSRQRLCSAQCRIDDAGMRVKDLYSLISEHRGQGPAAGWRKNLVDLLRDRDGDHCGICLLTIDFQLSSGPRGSDDGASIDHIQPRSLGGGDELSNLRLTHWRCNRKRSNKVHEDALFAA